MITPKLNQVPSQLRSLPYRPRSSFIPLTKALPWMHLSANCFPRTDELLTVIRLVEVLDEVTQNHRRAETEQLCQS